MKLFKKIKYITALSAILVAGNACTDWDELNTDPALVSDERAKPEMLLTNILRFSIYSTVNGTSSTVGDLGGMTSCTNCGSLFQATNYAGLNFSGRPIEAAEMIRLTSKDPLRRNQTQIGRILKVWLLHRYTDQWGDMPYFEALKSREEVINNPKYDTQDAIYRDMLKELKEAEELLEVDPNQLSFGNADILFQGNVERWKRFANSLRLRLAIRVRYADASLAQEHITDVLTKQLIETNAQNAQLATLASISANADNRSPIFLRYLSNPMPIFASLTMTESLKQRNDPRLPIYFEPATLRAPGDAGYRGRPIQIHLQQRDRYHQDSLAHLGNAFKQPVLQIKILTAAEVRFLRAEAALAGLSGGNAQTLLQEGIQLAMQEHNIASGTIDNYVASITAAFGGYTDERKLEEIIVQKYIALFMQADETWAEHRRTGYPRIWTGNDIGVTGGRILRRFTYPQLEYQINGTNVEEAANRLQGGDQLISRIWWDKKAGLLDLNGPYAHPRQGSFPPDPDPYQLP